MRRLSEDKPFYQDYLGDYYYDESCNEVVMFMGTSIRRLEVVVFIETLVDLVKELVNIQNFDTSAKEEE